MPAGTGSSTQPIAVRPSEPVAMPVAAAAADDGEFAVQLDVFSGPLQLLLQLIESRQLDVLTVPLAEVADAYVDYVARNAVPAAGLAEFVAIAAQLIELKSRRLLPAEPIADAASAADEPDEDALRQRLLEYRALRDAAIVLGTRDGTWAVRREPRESDLPPAPVAPIPASRLAEALDRLAAIPEPEPPPPEVVPREVTIGQQIRALTEALSRTGRLVLQAFLATCASRTERTVTFMAMLELIRRREVHAQQASLFGPIIVERGRRGAR
jgi:segregation and condensation protein A